jgi:hypothetical protein
VHTKKIAMRQDCKGLSTAEIIDLYKFYYSTADGVSNKRMQANNYFFGLHGALSSVALLLQNKVNLFLLDGITIIFIFHCVVWFKSIHYYKTLNSAKFKIINELELKNIKLALFNKEWEIIQNSKDKNKRLSIYEAYIPVGFILIYMILLINSNKEMLFEFIRFIYQSFLGLC